MIKTILSMFVFLILLCAPVFSQNINTCEDPNCRQFDFWLGTWDLTWADTNGADLKGTNTITKILNGCVIQEQFDGSPAMQFKGMSVSVFNARKKIWQQTWVDNQGGYLEFTGGFQTGMMMLERQAERNGQKLNQRMRWYDIKEDSLNWAWESSKDGGKSWQTNWLIRYKRKN